MEPVKSMTELLAGWHPIRVGYKEKGLQRKMLCVAVVLFFKPTESQQFSP